MIYDTRSSLYRSFLLRTGPTGIKYEKQARGVNPDKAKDDLPPVFVE